MIESENKDKIIYIILGAVIGSILAYALLKCRTQPQQFQLHPLQHTEYMNGNITVLEERLYNLEQQLKIKNAISQDSKPEMVQVMENDEDWEFKKDEKGKILGVRVHRKLFNVKE